MTTTTRRRVNPARCDLTVVRRMAYPCDLLPQGQPAHVLLNGKPYVVTCEGVGVYTFHGEGGRSHQTAGGRCCCEDYVYVREARQEPCKHLECLARMRAESAI
jgi:hypothetical protein